MKRKKFERQQREKAERENRKNQEWLNGLKTVALLPVNNTSIERERIYNWSCPDHDGTFTYSQKINEMWDHPTDLVFCGVCCKYHRFEINLPGEVDQT